MFVNLFYIYIYIYTTQYVSTVQFYYVKFLHDLWLLFSTINRRYLDFEQTAHNFSRSWYKICQHYSILKVMQSYTYLSHLLRNWVTQTYNKFFWKKLCKWVIFTYYMTFFTYLSLPGRWKKTKIRQQASRNLKVIHVFFNQRPSWIFFFPSCISVIVK